METREIGWNRILIGIGVSALLYYIWLLFQQIYVIKDGALYLLLARSLASGGGYVDSFMPKPLFHTSIPPGYPFILSLIIRAVGYNLLYLRAASVIFVAASLVILVKILKGYLKTREVVIVFFLFAFNPVFVGLTNTINSDIPYLLCLLVSFLIFGTGKEKPSIGEFMIGAAAIIAAFYMRVAGLALYCAALIYLLGRGKRREFFILAFSGFFILLWLYLICSAPQGIYYNAFLAKDALLPVSGYIKIADIPFRILENLKYYCGKVVIDLLFCPFFNEVTFGNPLFPLKICFSLLFSALFFAGFIRSVKKGPGFIDLYCAIYMCMLVLWSYHSARFLIPVYPFLLVYMIDALRIPRIRYIKLSLILLLACSAVIANLSTVKDFLEKRDPPQKPVFETYDWLKNNTSPGAIVMSDDPASVYLYSQRKATQWYTACDTNDFFDRVKKEKVDYVLVGRETMISVKGKNIDRFGTYFKPVIEKHAGCFELVCQSRARPEIMVYKTKKSEWQANAVSR